MVTRGLATSQSVSLKWTAEDRALLGAGAGMRLERSKELEGRKLSPGDSCKMLYCDEEGKEM